MDTKTEQQRVEQGPDFTGIRPFEGARVGLVSCHRCGAAVFFDPDDDFDTLLRHKAWHEENDSQPKKEASP